MFSNNNNDDKDIIFNDYFIMDLVVVRIKMNPNVSVLLFFWDSSAYWFSPRRSHLRSPPTTAADSLSPPHCALLQKYAAATCSFNGYGIVYHYYYYLLLLWSSESRFRRAPSADQVPTADQVPNARVPTADQSAACWLRPVRHPSRHRPSVRVVLSALCAVAVQCATSH